MSLEIEGFEFERFFLDSKEKILLRDGKPVPITPKTFQLLHLLIENHGHIVEKEEIMRKVWNGSFVEDSNLTFSISQLRKILGDDKHNPRFIETIPRRGYRFIAEVKENQENDKQNKSLELNETVSFYAWNSRYALFLIFSVLALFVLVTAGFFVWRSREFKNREFSADVNSTLKFEIVSSADKSIGAAISPHGKYIAYTNIINGQMSLWLKQLSSGINTQIIAPQNGAGFHGLEFSSDGEYIYFNRSFKGEPAHLDRVSILGGAVKTNILNDLDGSFSISPDNQRISFRRYTPRKRSLLIADINGGNEREIFTTTKTFTDNVFSPDGKIIAFASGQSDTGDRDFSVYTINAEGGEAKPATDFKWHHVRGIVWLPDQSGLLITARVKKEPQQLWKISLPSGEVKKITDSPNGFLSISATTDLSLILLIQASLSSNLYLASSAAPEKLRSLASANAGVGWTPEGNLIYSNGSYTQDIWLLNADKTIQKQLTTEDSSDFEPLVSPDGRYIVFISDRAGKYNLWRINADGSNPIQLTNGDGEQSPVFTPDGRFVVFNSMKDVSLWKVSIEGGANEQISDKRNRNISISPDGTKFVRFSKKDDREIIVVKSFPNGDVLQEFAIPEGYFAGSNIFWTKDGKFLIYAADDRNSVGNLWQQSLSEGSPQKLTNFNSEEVFHFALSPDNSQFAIIRGSWNHDIVLLKGFRQE